MLYKMKTPIFLVFLLVSNSYASPRVYPDDVLNDIDLYFDIVRAFDQYIEVGDPEILAEEFPGRTFEDFDRNRSGGFEHRRGPDVDPNDLAIFDIEMAILQFNHDEVDYDGDGLPGFFELECEFAEREPDAPAIVLSPTSTSTHQGIPDGEQDCDGDGISNEVELSFELNPLDGYDMDIDSDDDGLTNREEVTVGTDPFRGDTDGDGLGDAAEVGDSIENPLDSNENGIIDALEYQGGAIRLVSQGLVIAGGDQANDTHSVRGTLVVGAQESTSTQFTVKGELTP